MLLGQSLAKMSRFNMVQQDRQNRQDTRHKPRQVAWGFPHAPSWPIPAFGLACRVWDGTEKSILFRGALQGVIPKAIMTESVVGVELQFHYVHRIFFSLFIFIPNFAASFRCQQLAHFYKLHTSFCKLTTWKKEGRKKTKLQLCPACTWEARVCRRAWSPPRDCRVMEEKWGTLKLVDCEWYIDPCIDS